MRNKIVLLCLFIILIVFNFSIYQKEQIKSKGDEVYLKLRPVDPRSLLQGDYMRLAYEVEREIEKKESAKNGKVVLGVNEKKEGYFVKFYKGEELGKNQMLFSYGKHWGRLVLKPNTFLFQEGHRQLYEQAKYAIFKFNDKREILLFGLADKDKKIIKPKKEIKTPPPLENEPSRQN